ncbi:stage II sporulation protein E [Longirhabdus pacifica]|uniref:stage II sporulation protein E n=1 Tax=Longirhabdus pacifica TaxID=2305227 RepID=UPI001980B097|nr:stage II sporulation protein E [Longirhabdus pacifica]
MNKKQSVHFSMRTEWKETSVQYISLLRNKLLHFKPIQFFLAKKSSLFLLFIAFLLGRAMILEQLAPFSIAFFAVIYFTKRDIILPVFLSLCLGTFFSYHEQTFLTISSILLFWIAQTVLHKKGKSNLTHAPIVVFFSMLVVKLIAVTLLNVGGLYAYFLCVVEAGLSLILTLIFMQALPVLMMAKKNYQLKHEEIICLIILLASVMTGTVGWLIQGYSIDNILSRYLILLFAFVGGAPLGASVGVVTGLILSLANVEAITQMSLLAFSGMLAGLLREGNRLAVALGMILGTSIFSFYLGGQAAILYSTMESIAAVALFLLTPKSVIDKIAKYIPGTSEHSKSHYDYAKKVREMTSQRIKQFSSIFSKLSESFNYEKWDNAKEQHMHGKKEGFIEYIKPKTCNTCWKNKQCWGEECDQTIGMMKEMVETIEGHHQFNKSKWKSACVKPEQVMDVMSKEYLIYSNNIKWKKQLVDNKQLVADQLEGVSQVMHDLATEIEREGQAMFMQEEQIKLAFQELGLPIEYIDIISLDEGAVEIEIVHQYKTGYDECRKIIAPMLSEILSENIVVKREDNVLNQQGYQTVLFGSAKKYEVETGIASAAKNGDLLSGDSFTTIQLHNGKFAVALSDGMGNGERASEESKSALAILQQLLQSGMDEKLAIKSVNSILLLRSTDEMFATIDVAIIDQYSAQTTFLKIGSSPSFIKRGDEVILIEANNLPIGILQDIDIDVVGHTLQPGDILIMMTDGMYDAPGHAINKELWMKRVISEIDVEEPQIFADCLIEKVIRAQQGTIKDDMTLVVAKMEDFKPEWATFRWPGMSRIERPKTVS